MTEVHAFPEAKMKQLFFPNLMANTDKNSIDAQRHSNENNQALGDATCCIDNNGAGPSAAKQHKSTLSNANNANEKARLKAQKDKKRLLKRL